MSAYVTPLPLDFGVTVKAPDGETGRVIDVFHEDGWIGGRRVSWPVYVVQMPAYSVNLTAKQAAKSGWQITGEVPA